MADIEHNAPTAGFASPNFRHLARAVPLLASFGVRAERYVFDDPNTALMKLRQFGEALAQEVAARTGLLGAANETQGDRLRRLREAGVVEFEVADLFHALRRAGNDASHAHAGSQRDALHNLRIAWKLGVWFQRAFHDPEFKSGAFTPPPDPRNAEQALKAELEELRQSLATHQAELQQLRATADQQAELLQQATTLADTAYADVAVALELASDTEARAARMEQEFNARIVALQTQTALAPAATVDDVIKRARAASSKLDLDESETRLIVDQQLRAAGWQADSGTITYKQGVRPTKGGNLAIAEWPTASGPADYVLFAGLTPIAVVEAKRHGRNAAGSIEQAKRYSRSYTVTGEPLAPGAPFGEFIIPFLFATNGRRYLRQSVDQSGVWFLDARDPTNHPRALEDWYTPDGLLALLKQDIAAADERLRTERADYLPLRGYQYDAIAAVEAAIAAGQRDMLLAMATGTGKTRLALCLIYRLLKAGRFRRILFLVDRTALGEQALGAFHHEKLEHLQSLPEIYDVKGLGDLHPEPDTRLHVATVQGMVRRVILDGDDGPPVPVDWYDCVIVDECHRGYALDLEMTDTQLEFRNEEEYISKYRRVLDHFDAVRIGLTATPALHTTEIFGRPIFEYGYRQAVIDGFLVDHEPPIRIMTELNQEGIHWRAGDEVARYKSTHGQIELFNTPDDIHIDVEGFNRQVLTENFNRVVCDYLASQMDPMLDGKTMIFCATDAHADTVVRLLKASLRETWGPVEDDMVMKITGAADRPLDKLRRYKSERLPRFAVTVDLLTTGIDVPQITSLVFIRRVRSRILYEQMVGRATRLCPDIGKEFFRIYDAVDLYQALEPFTAMKPVVARPHLSFTQLVDELLTVHDDSHRRSVVDEILAKLQVRRRRFTTPQEQSFETLTGHTPPAVIRLLKSGDTDAAVSFFAAHPTVAPFLDSVRLPHDNDPLVADHSDTLIGTERGYGDATRPEEYLAGFAAYIDSHKNQLDALMVVTQRPRDLTRKQLRELKLQLDQAGYPERAVQTAFAQLRNHDIAASIIGFIRQQALGSPLVPYEQRVDRALSRVMGMQSWTPKQTAWLKRIGKQLKQEVVVDRASLDRGQFEAEGGFALMNKVFDGRLEEVLATLHEQVWQDDEFRGRA